MTDDLWVERGDGPIALRAFLDKRKPDWQEPLRRLRLR